MKDFMVIDFETLKTTPDAVILAFGAYFVSLKDGIPDYEEIIKNGFYRTFDTRSQIEEGRKIGKDTLEWWKSQSVEAQRILLESDDDIKLPEFLADFREYIDNNSNNSEFWIFARSPSFDYSILDNIRGQYNEPEYWKFWNEKDTRTFIDAMLMNLPISEKFNKFHLPSDLCPNEVVEHNALHDVALDVKRLHLLLEVWAKTQYERTAQDMTIDEAAKLII